MPHSGMPSRRDVLRLTGGALGGIGASGVAGASSGRNRDLDGLLPETSYNVGFSERSGRQAALDLAAVVVRRFSSLDVLTIRATETVAEILREREDVRYVEKNGRMHAIAQSVPWGVDRIDADVAHEAVETPGGADVAIIDTGIDSDHPDLRANLGEGKAVVECGEGLGCVLNGGLLFGESNECNEPWDDDHDHGSHVAGIAGAVDNDRTVVGVATGATLHAVKVLDCQGAGSFSDVARGIEIVAEEGWDVANMSLGGNRSSAVKDAVEHAAEKGVTLVAAAGNSGPCTDCVGYPAAFEEVIAVSATDRNDDLAKYSSQGPEVEIAAPGTDVTSTVPGGTATFSGTSMASPHVAGAAGQLAARGRSRSAIRQQLTATAEDIGLSENESGAGLLDDAALLDVESKDDLGESDETDDENTTSDTDDRGDTGDSLDHEVHGDSTADRSSEDATSGILTDEDDGSGTVGIDIGL